MRALVLALALTLLVPATRAAASADPDPERWLEGLTDRVIADLAAGRPLVVQVHVPLCDNDIIPCGNARLGDGDNPRTNLYWSTRPGFARWFTRKGSGWKAVATGDGDALGLADVLEVRVYARTVTASRDWRRRGAPDRFAVYVVAFAWRGSAIDAALDAYAADLYGSRARRLPVGEITLEAGGAAHLVAYVGHNRLMDRDYVWPRARAAEPKGAIAIACHTAAYMEGVVPAATRVPLLMTRDYLFANAAPLEGAVLAFAEGGGYPAIRQGAAEGYADAQQREVRKIRGAFTNPADRRWGR
jgi:hypothetical protein